MPLFLLAAIIIYVAIPGGLVISLVAAIVVGALASAYSILIGGAGTWFAARGTGSKNRPKRLIAWGALLFATSTATLASLAAAGCLAVIAVSTLLLPNFLLQF